MQTNMKLWFYKVREFRKLGVNQETYSKLRWCLPFDSQAHLMRTSDHLKRIGRSSSNLRHIVKLKDYKWDALPMDSANTINLSILPKDRIRFALKMTKLGQNRQEWEREMYKGRNDVINQIRAKKTLRRECVRCRKWEAEKSRWKVWIFECFGFETNLISLLSLTPLAFR